MLGTSSPSGCRDQGGGGVTPGEPHPFDFGQAHVRVRDVARVEAVVTGDGALLALAGYDGIPILQPPPSLSGGTARCRDRAAFAQAQAARSAPGLVDVVAGAGG
ncbi:MAG: hypothetical protein ACRDY0_02315 [Acidimicrobiales bacterium]